MKISQPSIRFGTQHCCQCAQDRGSICAHVNGPFFCTRHTFPMVVETEQPCCPTCHRPYVGSALVRGS